MVTRMEQMMGEQLLLMSVLYGPEVHAAVERELDRRALVGVARSPRPCRHARRPSTAMHRLRPLGA